MALNRNADFPGPDLVPEVQIPAPIILVHLVKKLGVILDPLFLAHLTFSPSANSTASAFGAHPGPSLYHLSTWIIIRAS